MSHGAGVRVGQRECVVARHHVASAMIDSVAIAGPFRLLRRGGGGRGGAHPSHGARVMKDGGVAGVTSGFRWELRGTAGGAGGAGRSLGALPEVGLQGHLGTELLVVLLVVSVLGAASISTARAAASASLQLPAGDLRRGGTCARGGARARSDPIHAIRYMPDRT